MKNKIKTKTKKKKHQKLDDGRFTVTGAVSSLILIVVSGKKSVEIRLKDEKYALILN